MISIISEILRFGLVGAAATLMYAIAAFAARHVGFDVFVSNALGFVSGFAVSVCGHHFYSFRSDGPLWLSAVKYAPVALSALLLNTLLLAALVFLLGRSRENLALLLAIAVVPALSYVISRNYVFRRVNGAGAARSHRTRKDGAERS